MRLSISRCVREPLHDRTEEGVQMNSLSIRHCSACTGRMTRTVSFASALLFALLTLLFPSRADASWSFGSAPAPIPGLLQAEGYDNGGEGDAFHDNDWWNWGGFYRSDAVDLTWASGGTGLVGWVGAGEWLKYSVNVQNAGAYDVDFYVASYGQGGVFHLEMNGVPVSGGITIPNTGGWQSWQTVTARVQLQAGQQVLRVVMDSNGDYAVGNFDWIRFRTAGSTDTIRTGGQLRVMTWNIQSGRDAYGNWNLDAQVRLMADQNPDVVILQEVSIYDYDQPSHYKNALQGATGRTWYTAWAPSCSSGGCLGNLILSRLPLQSASMIFMPPSAAAQATVSVGGVPVTLFGAHLDAYNTDVRTAEMFQLLGWSSEFWGNKIIGGDFNSWWGQWWIQYIVGAFGGDTWREASGQQDGGYTIGNVRFDYLFKQGNLSALSCWVPWTDLSDHRPVVADYQVR